MNEAAAESLEPDAEKVKQSPERIRQLLSREGLTDSQKRLARFNLALALFHGGDFSRALAELDAISSEPDKSQSNQINLYRASCYAGLGKPEDALKVAEDVWSHIEEIPKQERPGFLLELGKIFSSAGDTAKGEACWTAGAELTRGDEDQVGNHARLLANIAGQKLRSGNEAAEADGVKLMEEACELKASVGDVHGLANSHDMLAIYFWRIGRYERALTHFRKDLAYSRIAGDRYGLAQTFSNIAGLYGNLRQPQLARQALREAESIATELHNPKLLEFISKQRSVVETAAREWGVRGEKIGPKAPCICESGKSFEECCGLADHEPVSLPWNFGGLAQDLDDIIKDLKNAGVEPTRLDYLLRDTPNSGERIAWSRVHNKDGWVEVKELADIANLQLRAASEAAETANQKTGTMNHALSALILSACALEAFINQVVFLIVDSSKIDDLGLGAIPPELSSDHFEFQRKTELTEKWKKIGCFLCGSSWPKDKHLWEEFVTLLAIRNEYVHFKADDYETIVPPPKKPQGLLKLLPSSIPRRKEMHSSPFLVLSPEFASWAVDVAKRMMSAVRREYAANRKNVPPTGKTTGNFLANP